MNLQDVLFFLIFSLLNIHLFAQSPQDPITHRRKELAEVKQPAKKFYIYIMGQEEIKRKILEEISKTEQLIEEYKELTKPVAPDVAIGRISRMDAINNKSVNEAALRHAEQKLHSLNRVLSMYGTSDFGRCLKCRAEIPLGRILIRPESLYCVNCAR